MSPLSPGGQSGLVGSTASSSRVWSSPRSDGRRIDLRVTLFAGGDVPSHRIAGHLLRPPPLSFWELLCEQQFPQLVRLCPSCGTAVALTYPVTELRWPDDEMTQRLNTDKIAKVLVASDGEQAAATVVAIAQGGAACVELDGDGVLDYLRCNPLDVMAIVLIGEGETEETFARLRAIKLQAPRVPIIFLDRNDSAASELRVRRQGVHFYSHTPPSSRELTAVVSVLIGGLQSAALAGVAG